MPLTPRDFVSKWKRVTAREKQTYQEHFLDLCHLVGHPTPNEYNPTGSRFAKGKDSDLELTRFRLWGLAYPGTIVSALRKRLI